ncbi:hypothetical protein AAHE18_03G112400 [Arachis hypogaea]
MAQLHNTFSLKDLGEMYYFLGIEVSSSSIGTVILKQTKYIIELLKKSDMINDKPVPTPMNSSLNLSTFGDSTFNNHILYRFIVGTIRHGLRFSKFINFRIYGFCDSDWASDVDDRKSTNGFAIYLGSNLVSWASRKKTAASKSSTEAEFRGISNAVTKIVWLQNLLAELKISCSIKPIIYCDNQSVVLLSANLILHNKSKYFVLSQSFVREFVTKKEIFVQYILAQDQLVNTLTKPLSATAFLKFRDLLRVFEVEL